MRERVVLILDGIKGGSLQGFPLPSLLLTQDGRSVHLDGWHSYGKFARDPRSRLTPCSTLSRLSVLQDTRYCGLLPDFEREDVYIYLYVGVGWIESRESLKFSIFLSFSAKRCYYLKFYMNELTWLIEGEMNFSWNEDINKFCWKIFFIAVSLFVWFIEGLSNVRSELEI